MHSRTIDVDGPVHVADWGGDGPTMVLVHGLGGSHLNWMAVGERLAERHRVLAPDLPGFGLTPPGNQHITVEALHRHLDRVLDELSDEPVILVGNSMGGLICALQAAHRPQRVSALILVAAVLPAPWRHRWDPLVLGAFTAYAIPGFGSQVMTRVRRKVGADELVRQALMLCTVDVTRLSPEMVEAHTELYRERGVSPDNDRAFIAAARSLVRANFHRHRTRRMMRSIVAPTLLVHGNRDRLVNVRSSMQAATLRPDWDLKILSRVGHVPMMEVPDKFCDTVETWLEEKHISHAPAASAALADLA